MNKLYIILPCYNEIEVLPHASKLLLAKIRKLISDGAIDKDSKLVFVNDGSKDLTWDKIKELHELNKEVIGINLAANRGQQYALIAGIEYAAKYADMIVTMDVDLQDDINAIDKMIEKYKQGVDIVFGVRDKRDKDSFIKKFFALSYYRVMKMLGVDIVSNHAEYRLMSKRVALALKEYREKNIFLRQIIKNLGFNQDIVYYDRDKRYAGETKYSTRKLFLLAFESITSFSIKPIRFILSLGFIFLGLSLIIFIYALISKLNGVATSGWASLILSIWFIGGCQMIAIGIIGEYIAKIYLETKNRPRYDIESILD